MYLSDYHTHCSLSFDSKTPVEDMVRAGIAQGLDVVIHSLHKTLPPEGDGALGARFFES